MKGLIAIPTDLPAGPATGLDDALSAHFGQCSGFALIEWRDGRIAGASVLAAPPHEEGGCMARVRLLAQHGVSALIATGAGGRALMALDRAGISSWRGLPSQSVAASLAALEEGRLEPFLEGCTAHGGCGHD